MVAKRLYKAAKEEMNRQELRRKMAIADAEVTSMLSVCFVLMCVCVCVNKQFIKIVDMNNSSYFM